MFIAYGLGVLRTEWSRRSSGLVALVPIVAQALALGATVIARAFRSRSLSLNSCRWAEVCVAADSLGAFFLVVIGVGAIPAALYGAGYTAVYEDGRASLRLLGMMFNLFLLTMSLVTLADNVLTFLLM